MAVARQCGYAVIGVGDGDSALLVLHSEPRVAALVVDVALPGVLGYELCEDIAAHELGTATILIASVYSKTAYKRQPGSLYGAADYVEQHHIVDQLPVKLERVLAGARPARMRRRPVSQTGEQKARAIREAGEGRLAFSYRSRSEGAERARNLARLLIADVMLYGGDAVQAWREDGARGEYPASLRDDVVEARRLYELRVPRELAREQDYFGDMVRALFAPSRPVGEVVDD